MAKYKVSDTRPTGVLCYLLVPISKEVHAIYPITRWGYTKYRYILSMSLGIIIGQWTRGIVFESKTFDKRNKWMTKRHIRKYNRNKRKLVSILVIHFNLFIFRYEYWPSNCFKWFSKMIEILRYFTIFCIMKIFIIVIIIVIISLASSKQIKDI